MVKSPNIGTHKLYTREHSIQLKKNNKHNVQK